MLLVPSALCSTTVGLQLPCPRLPIAHRSNPVNDGPWVDRLLAVRPRTGRIVQCHDYATHHYHGNDRDGAAELHDDVDWCNAHWVPDPLGGGASVPLLPAGPGYVPAQSTRLHFAPKGTVRGALRLVLTPIFRAGLGGCRREASTGPGIVRGVLHDRGHDLAQQCGR